MDSPGTLRTVRTDVLEIAYLELGAADRPDDTVVLLHGFPYDVHAYDDVAASLAAGGRRVIVPFLRGYGPTRFLDPGTLRSGQQGALGADLLDLLDALAIERATLVGYDWGGRAACIVAALHPTRVQGLVTVGGYNIQNIAASSRPTHPADEHRSWYQHYFNADRGPAGLAENRDELCHLLWRLWSPTWDFAEETFAATARSFANPDFVDVVIHSYRHRFGRVAGDPRYDVIERELAARPPIDVPTMVLRGGDDGVDPPRPDSTAPSGLTRLVGIEIVPGAGHNLPQERPAAVVAAVEGVERARA